MEHVLLDGFLLYVLNLSNIILTLIFISRLKKIVKSLARRDLLISRELFGIKHFSFYSKNLPSTQNMDIGICVVTRRREDFVQLLLFSLLIMRNSKSIYIYIYVSSIFTDFIFRCVIALIRGLRGLLPCPICTIRQEDLWDLLNISPLRTTQMSRQILEEARGQRLVAQKEEILKHAGLRDIEVCNTIYLNLFTKYLF